MTNTYTLVDIIKYKTALKVDLEFEDKRHKEFLSNYHNKLNELNSLENELKHNVDMEKFNRGQRLLLLQFPRDREQGTYSNIYKNLVEEAKEDIANGATYLKKYYIGQKYYEGYDQREDHKYCYGPAHGTIYQRIGLREPEKELDEYDLECCLYLLENIDVVLENVNNKESK